MNPGLGQALMFMQSEESILFKEKKKIMNTKSGPKVIFI